MKRGGGATFVAAVLVAVALAAARPTAAIAAATDYVFEAQAAQMPASNNAIISVRLVHKASGKPVLDAVIFQSRLDMSPDAMAEMTAPVEALPAAEPGVYRFKADLGMAGRWALKLAAKVPGEHETVRGEVIVVATP